MKVTAADVKRFALELDLMPDDVFSDPEVEQYALDYLNMCSADDCPPPTDDEVREYAQDLGMIDPSDLDEGTLTDAANAAGYMLASQSDVEYAHDTQGHTGAVQWCREGACGLTY